VQRWKGGVLPVERRGGGAVCVPLPRAAGAAASPPDRSERYVRVSVEDGVAKAPLLAYLYDLGPTRGYFLAGADRPEP